MAEIEKMNWEEQKQQLLIQLRQVSQPYDLFIWLTFKFSMA